LAVVDGAQKLALIDTSDFEPVAAKSVAADAERPSSGSVGWPSVLLGLSGALVAGVAYALVRRRKKSEEATRNAAPTHPVAHERRSSLRA